MSSFTSLSKIKPPDFLALAINLLVLLLTLFLVFYRKPLTPNLPIWFSKPWGEERLSTPGTLWLFPVFIISFLIVNTLVASLLKKENLVAAKILVWASTFISLILLFSLYKILVLVI